MATVAGIMGGMAGFVMALLGLALFGVTWTTALALWMLGGLALAVMLMGLAMLPQRGRLQSMETKHA